MLHSVKIFVRLSQILGSNNSVERVPRGEKDHEFIIEFLQLYRQYQTLWKVRSL